MKAVITVVGHDTVGIIAKITAYCAEHQINIIDISQSILSEFFCMIMLVDFKNSTEKFADTVDRLTALGTSMGLSIHVMHEDIFNSMHNI